MRERILNLKRRIRVNLYTTLTRRQPHFITASGIIVGREQCYGLGILGEALNIKP